nr:putative reverse transcriptase domain, PPM-type phosphatase domain, protein phosphatase 2C family [Tanacetum cinerariifolium]
MSQLTTWPELKMIVGNKMHKAFPLPGESSHWQYKFPLPVKVVLTARRLEMPLPKVCTVIEETMKKLSDKVVAQPDYIDAWVRLLLFPRCTLQVYRPKNRQERRSRNRKSLQQSSILKSLAMWGKDDDITTLVKSILDGSTLGSFGQGGGDFLEEGATGNTNIKQCLRKVADGHFIAAVKVLSSSGVAPYCDDTIKALEAKPPYKPPPSMPNITFLSLPCEELSAYLGRVCGVEAILHNVNRLLSDCHNDGSIAMLVVDFLNAFNLVDRLALLHEQSDPLGPILFALILHSLLYKIKDSCKLLLHAWYLDDGTVIGDSKEVAMVLDIIKVSGPNLGLELNIKKTEIFWPSCNGMKLREGLFPIDIQRPSSGVKLLWGVVSRDTDFISGLAMRRATNAVDLMGLLPQLHDPIDGDFLLYLFNLVVWVCTQKNWFPPMLLLPRGPNLSFTSKDTVPYKAQQTMTNVFFSEMVKDMEVYFDMTMRQKAVFECLCTPNAQDFLLAISIDGLGQHISPVEYHTILKDVLFDICRRVGIFAKKEAPVKFLTHPSDGRSTLRPADVLVFGWVGGKHACVDLTGVSPLVGLISRGFTAGQTTLKAASGKVTKHEKACIKNQYVFIPFAFDTFGFLARRRWSYLVEFNGLCTTML